MISRCELRSGRYLPDGSRSKERLRTYRKNLLTWSQPALKDWLETHVDKAHIKQMMEDGQLDKSVLEKMNGDGENVEVTELELIRCPNCGEPNSPERDFCDTCNQPFNKE